MRAGDDDDGDDDVVVDWWWQWRGRKKRKLREKIYRKWRRKNTTNEGRGREQRTEGIESTLRCRRSKSSGTRRVRGRQRITATAKAVSEYAFSVARAGRETHPSQAGRLALDDWTRLAMLGVCLVAACVRASARTIFTGPLASADAQPARHGHGWMGDARGVGPPHDPT